MSSIRALSQKGRVGYTEGEKRLYILCRESQPSAIFNLSPTVGSFDHYWNVYVSSSTQAEYKQGLWDEEDICMDNLGSIE